MCSKKKMTCWRLTSIFAFSWRLLNDPLTTNAVHSSSTKWHCCVMLHFKRSRWIHTLKSDLMWHLQNFKREDSARNCVNPTLEITWNTCCCQLRVLDLGPAISMARGNKDNWSSTTYDNFWALRCYSGLQITCWMRDTGGSCPSLGIFLFFLIFYNLSQPFLSATYLTHFLWPIQASKTFIHLPRHTISIIIVWFQCHGIWRHRLFWRAGRGWNPFCIRFWNSLKENIREY